MRRNTHTLICSALFKYRAEVSILAACSILYFWVATYDSTLRTVFVEEYNSGEAARAAFLFGIWRGEGGEWQSWSFQPASTYLTWLGLDLFGFSRLSTRIPFVLTSGLAMFAYARSVAYFAGSNARVRWAAIAAISLSPFLIEVLPTANAQVLFVPIVAFSIYLVCLEDTPWFDRHWRTQRFLLAFVAGSAVFVKIDGALLPLVVCIHVAICWMADRAAWKQLMWFAAGATTILSLYIGFLMLGPGLDEYLSGWRMTSDILADRGETTVPIDFQAERLTLWNFKNLSLFFPGIEFLLFASGAAVALEWKRARPGDRFVLLFVLAFFLFSLNFPLIYWKRFLLVAPACVLLCLSAVRLWSNNHVVERPLFLRGIMIASLLLGYMTATSWFNGMWRIVPGWSDPVDQWHGLTVLLIGGLALVCFIPQRFFGRAIVGGFALMCGVTVLSGVQELAHERTREMESIASNWGARLNGATVVSDHHAYRFLAYGTSAQFDFTHENDPSFPERVINLVLENQPDYIAVSNAYHDFADEISTEVPNYAMIDSFEYTHPASQLSPRATVHHVSLYERRYIGEQPQN
ncbi:MAG: hypothetical protein P8P99_13170 [Maricaulis sp.]|nr:hypothetical protein [Maricaulis sp.]